MNIGPYTFEEFKTRAAEFHGYPAPGLVFGGYMVAMAQRALPGDTLFEALVETKKCLPDAVQLLTLCSLGNNWMKVINLGRYAVSLYDKYTGEGFRVHPALDRLGPYPQIRAWLLKTIPKKEQDSQELFRELERDGDSVLDMRPVRIDARLLGHSSMGDIAACSRCGEAYPADDGECCLGCLGGAPYTLRDGETGAARGGMDGKPDPIRVSRLDYLDLSVTSLEKSLNFYNLLGMKIVQTGEGSAALGFGKQKINLHEQGRERPLESPRATPGGAAFCLVLKTPLKEALSRLKRAGVSPLAGQEAATEERLGATGRLLSISVRDPDGNVIELANSLP